LATKFKQLLTGDSGEVNVGAVSESEGGGSSRRIVGPGRKNGSLTDLPGRPSLSLGLR